MKRKNANYGGCIDRRKDGRGRLSCSTALMLLFAFTTASGAARAQGESAGNAVVALSTDETESVRVTIPRRFLVGVQRSGQTALAQSVAISFYLGDGKLGGEAGLSLHIEDALTEKEELSLLGEAAGQRELVSVKGKRGVLLSISIQPSLHDRTLTTNYKMIGLDDSGTLERWVYSRIYFEGESVILRPVGEPGVTFLCLSPQGTSRCTMNYALRSNIKISATVPRTLLVSWKELKSLFDGLIEINQ